MPRPWLMETISIVSVRPPPDASELSLPSSKTLVTSKGTAKVGTGVGMAVAGVGTESVTPTAPVTASEGTIWGILVGVAVGIGVSVGVGVLVGVLDGVGLGPDVGDTTLVGDEVSVGDNVAVGGTAVSLASGDGTTTLAEGASVGSADWALEIRLWQPTRPKTGTSAANKSVKR